MYIKKSVMSVRNPSITFVQILTTVTFTTISCNGDSEQVIGIEGLKASLPCNITPSSESDSPALILWYKDKSPTPIYTIDARRISFDQARHSSVDWYASRSRVVMTSNPPGSLELDPVIGADEGDYRCRVDFRRERTRYTDSLLKVIVLPKKPAIKNEKGKELRSLIGPYTEGETVVLVCYVEGGNPLPSVTWWRESVLLDDTFTSLTNERIVVNELNIESLQRHDLMASFTCQARNNNISKPLSSDVTVDINFRPLAVEIHADHQAFSAGHSSQLVCRATGSRPAAVISWWTGATELEKAKSSVSVDGNVTTSYLTFKPSPDDDGKTVYCRAENPFIPNSIVEEEVTLVVYYVPKVSVAIPRHLSDATVRKGHDIFLECHVNANPPVSEVGWIFEGRELRTNKSEGIIVTNHSLVLQGVDRNKKGSYTCTASNVEGQGMSEPLLLCVQFPPTCKPSQRAVYAVAINEPVNIHCEVEAEPPEVTFKWSFNDSKDIEDSLVFKSNLTSSVASFTPRKQYHYGTLQCWGKNEVGSQTEPCLFNVIPKGKPRKPLSCNVNNRTSVSITVSCLKGHISQSYVFQVYNTASETLEVNFTSTYPVFTARGLSSGSTFLISVYSFNQNGRNNTWTSIISTLSNSTPEVTAPESDRTDFVKAILMILSAVVVGLILVILVILLGMKFRKKEKSGKKPGETSIGDENRDEEFHLKDVGENYTALSAFDDEMCPDLIPEMRNTMEGARVFSTTATRWPCPQKDISEFQQISVRRQREFEEKHVRPALDCFIPQIATVRGFSPESSLRVKVLPHAPFLKQRDPGQLKELSFSEELNTTV